MPAENCTPQMGVPAPGMNACRILRWVSRPCGHELQTEYFVPREYSYAAIKAVEQLRDKVSLIC